MAKGKDPAFLFYPGDWLGGTLTFTRPHKGAYMDLLMCQFNCGHMSLDDIKTVLGPDFDTMWEQKLKGKFKVDENGCYYNEKLEDEQIKRRNFTNSRRKNLTHTEQHKEPHMNPHMDNENENINNNKNRSSLQTEYDTFEEFWRLYPRKVGKQSARKAWKKISSHVATLGKIKSALKWQCESEQWKKDHGQFIPHPATYLNQGRWDDEKFEEKQPEARSCKQCHKKKMNIMSDGVCLDCFYEK